MLSIQKSKRVMARIITRYEAQSFYDAMIFNMIFPKKYMLELILHQQRTPQLLKQKKLMQTQEDHSNPILALNVDSLKVDLVVIQNTCSEKEDSNSETASSKLRYTTPTPGNDKKSVAEENTSSKTYERRMNKDSSDARSQKIQNANDSDINPFMMKSQWLESRLIC
ncbi:hypothetical protein Tco_0618766 [Tanacetum coccineum]